MASGAKPNDECITTFLKLKQKTFSYVIYTMNPAYTEIIVQSTGDSRNFDDFTMELPESECRWAVYDFENKLVLVSWMPDTAKTKQKLSFASSKDALKGSLDGIAKEVPAESTMDLDAILK